MKKFTAIFTMILVMVVCFFSSCGESFLDEEAKKQNPTPSDTIISGDTIVINDTLIIRTPVWVDIIGSGDTIMRDGEGDTIWLRPDSLYITITCQDTVTVSSDTPWALLGSEINPQTPVLEMISGTTMWGYNHGDLPVKVIIYGIFRGRKLPLWKPERLRLEQVEYEPNMTDSTSVLNVEYVLSIENIFLAHRSQVLCTTTSTYYEVEFEKLFAHKAFRPNATVNGSNIAIICDNTATFNKTNDVVVNYIVTNNFTYNIDDYVSIDAIGNTYYFEGNTATVIGKNVTVSFANRVVSDIMFNNVNYKDSVPQCEIAVKSIKFGENTATITFMHDNETVTAIVPVNYNSIIKYEIVGNPIHDMWNSVYATSNGFAINCNNHVVVKAIWADGSEGENSELPYVSTNEWSVEGNKEIIVENLNSVIGVREEIVNGTVTIGLSTINFYHTMSAEKVTKDNFSYQPTPCEAVARYITVVSKNTAVVEIFHENDKIGEYELPIHLTEIIVIPGRIIRGNRSDAYADQVSARETWDFILASVNGRNTVYSKQEGGKTFNSEEIANFGAMTASDPFAYWYDASAGRHLGTLTAIKMDKNSKEAYFIQYLDFNKQVMYTLGTAEDALNNNYRNPERATFERVVKNGKVLWTDGQVFYRGTED